MSVLSPEAVQSRSEPGVWGDQPWEPVSGLLGASQGLPAERWLPVLGYEGYYEVSDLGRVRSLSRVIRRSDGRVARYKGRILSASRVSGEYQQVRLSKDGEVYLRQIHVLVLTAFVGIRPLGAIGCHGVKGVSDNSANNLSWGTRSKNALDRQRDGTDWMRNRIACPRNHRLAYPNLVEFLFNKTGTRNCKACAYAKTRCHQAELKGQYLDFETEATYQYRRIIARSFGLTAAEARRSGKTGLIPLPGTDKILPVDAEAALLLREAA